MDTKTVSETVQQEKVVKPKKVISDKQRESLRKGVEVLRAKREANKLAKEAKPVVPVTPPSPVDSGLKETPKEIPKKKYNKTPVVSKNEFNDFRTEVLGLLKSSSMYQPVHHTTPVAPQATPVVTQAPPVENVRYLSSSELLNQIFFNKVK